MNIVKEFQRVNQIVDVTLDILEDAVKNGFKGFGGYCAQAAVLINECLFDNQQKYLGAFNKALEKNNYWIGHVVCYVELDDCFFIFDTDCKIKDIEDIEQWGILDYQDLDYKKLFKKYKIVENDENYENVIKKFLKEEDLRKHFLFDSYQDQKEILLKSCTNVLEQNFKKNKNIKIK